MNARVIEVHIEELVLHGFSPGSGANLADAVQTELHGLLAAHGVPTAWRANPEKLDAGAIPASAQARPTLVGEQIARAVYQGGAAK